MRPARVRVPMVSFSLRIVLKGAILSGCVGITQSTINRIQYSEIHEIQLSPGSIYREITMEKCKVFTTWRFSKNICQYYQNISYYDDISR